MEFYKNVSKSLLLFNLMSIFFLILTIFVYSIIQYMFQPLVDISSLLFDEQEVIDSLTAILELAMVLPSMLDYAFLLLFFVLIFDLVILAWKTNTGSIFNTMAFTLVGLPVWVYLMSIITNFKNWALDFLGSAITYNINLRFFSFIQANSLEISIFIFMIIIAIRTIPWDNVKEFTSGFLPKNRVEDEKNLNDLLKQ